MSAPVPQQPTGHASTHYDTGRAYMTDMAESLIAVICDQANRAVDLQADADTRLRPLDTWRADELRDFIAGCNRTIEEYLLQAHRQRPTVVPDGENDGARLPRE